MVDYRVTPEDRERVTLLHTVEKKGLKALPLSQLKRLQILIEKKDYGHSKKAQKSKMKLLSKINVAVYEAEEGKEGI